VREAHWKQLGMGERVQSKVQRLVLLSKTYPALQATQLLGAPQVRQLGSQTAWQLPSITEYPVPQARHFESLQMVQ
jgi:hypothetical protein